MDRLATFAVPIELELLEDCELWDTRSDTTDPGVVAPRVSWPPREEAGRSTPSARPPPLPCPLELLPCCCCPELFIRRLEPFVLVWPDRADLLLRALLPRADCFSGSFSGPGTRLSADPAPGGPEVIEDRAREEAEQMRFISSSTCWGELPASERMSSREGARTLGGGNFG